MHRWRANKWPIIESLPLALVANFLSRYLSGREFVTLNICFRPCLTRLWNISCQLLKGVFKHSGPSPFNGSEGCKACLFFFSSISLIPLTMGYFSESINKMTKAFYINVVLIMRRTHFKPKWIMKDLSVAVN